jgi:hypothetical protein
MNTTNMKDRIISLLSEVDRKGIDNLIKFIEDSNYLTSAQCYSHHKCQHGLMMHSLEVLDCMLNNNLAGIPRESIILVALCHDLGKARLGGRKVGAGPHPSRSISILKRCGVELTKDEESAILNHHPKGLGKWINSALKSPLQVLLQMGDCRSTGLNKRGKTYRFSAI